MADKNEPIELGRLPVDRRAVYISQASFEVATSRTMLLLPKIILAAGAVFGAYLAYTGQDDWHPHALLSLRSQCGLFALGLCSFWLYTTIKVHRRVRQLESEAGYTNKS